jgi:hypothetical protein
MTGLPKTRALYDELANELRVSSLPIDQNGGVQLTVGESTTVVMYGESDLSLLIVAPIAALPREPEYGLMAWLFRKNLYDSNLAPFRIATDANANLLLWGRVPLSDLTGASLAGLIDSLASEIETIRDEIDPNP